MIVPASVTPTTMTMTAKVTVWPSQIQARIVETGHNIGGSFDNRRNMLGYVFDRLLQEGVETVEIRVENTDD